MPAFRLFLFLVLSAVLSEPAVATAQSFQTSMGCAAEYSRCERNADSQSHGGGSASQPAACAAYARCQAKAQCRADKCICDRTHGSADPALAQEAASICFAVVSPHGPNGCDRYAEQCVAAMNAAAHPPAAQPVPPQTQPGQTGRFR